MEIAKTKVFGCRFLFDMKRLEMWRIDFLFLSCWVHNTLNKLFHWTNDVYRQN